MTNEMVARATLCFRWYKQTVYHRLICFFLQRVDIQRRTRSQKHTRSMGGGGVCPARDETQTLGGHNVGVD